MIECPVTFGDDDKWIAMSFFAFLIKSDKKMKGLEIGYFKKRFSKILDFAELEYFNEIMNREFDQDYFDKIKIPDNKIIAKHILKEAIALSFIDGDYSKDEQDIIKKWAVKNGFDESFVEDLETYVMFNSRLDNMGDDLLNNHPSSAETHSFFKKLQSVR